MKIRDVMTHNIKMIPSDATAKEAAEMMKALDVGALPISENEQVMGIITDRDIVVRVVAEGHDPADTMVKFVMTKDVATCREEDEVQQAARLMESRQIRRLLVLNKENQVCGIVSLGDIAVDTEDKNLSGEILREVSEPVKSKTQ